MRTRKFFNSFFVSSRTLSTDSILRKNEALKLSCHVNTMNHIIDSSYQNTRNINAMHSSTLGYNSPPPKKKHKL